MTRFSFTIAATDGKARTGMIAMKSGDIRTPAFMPVGTAATVKAMKPEAVRATLQNVNKLVTDNQAALHDSMENLKTFSKALADNSSRIDSIMVGVDSLMGGKDGEGGELQKAARSFRELADNLDKRTAALTSDGRALISDSRRTLGDISRAVNNFDRNPTRVLFGASATDNRTAPPQPQPAPVPARPHRPPAR